MIEIRCGKNEIDIKGHAEYGEAGKDLVCCAVSTLFFTLVDNLNEMPLNHLEINHSNGLGYVKAVTWQENKTVNTMFDFTIKGFELIAYNFPEYVKVSREG